MEKLINFISNVYNFDVKSINRKDIVIKCMKADAIDFAKDILRLKDDVSTSNIKLFHMGNERQYELYKIYFILETQYDMDKIISKIKEYNKISQSDTNFGKRIFDESLVSKLESSI